MQQKNIHWFPGHMQKATREIEERVKIVDVIIELLDARAPLSSRNEKLYKITQNKKRVLILTKKDLADDVITEKWKEYFTSLNYQVVCADLNEKKLIKVIEEKINILGRDKREKEIKKGMKPQPIRAMIIGIPNVGKSTLINRISKRNSASVQNTPGHTKSQQWIKVDNSFELLDTPGILPANYENKEYAINLALVGSIRETILPIEELADILLNYLRKYYPETIKNRYVIDFNEKDDNNSILCKIALKRGFLLKQEPDVSKASSLLLKEFRDGILGHISLERL
ncbi:MAG: ribosome biogenesis GTPase YlqF [Erysipelotrichaceae bacterium]|nr:ribosome biogenesis GTPase YlqF [Erysipelotrichaceae bacterium]